MKRLAQRIFKRLGINPADVMYNLQAFVKAGYSFFDKQVDSQNRMINIGGSRFYKRHWKVLDYRHPSTDRYDFPGIDYNFDLTSGLSLPFANDQVLYFYSSHTLEHIPQEFVPHILREIHRCLKPGGALRITLPDFDKLWQALQAEDWDSIVNITGSKEYDRWRGAVFLYGEREASKILPAWQKEFKRRRPPFDRQLVADAFIGDFAGYWRGRVTLDDLTRLASEMNVESFADKFCLTIPREWQAAHPQEHINWWNLEKMSLLLKAAGFSRVYQSTPYQSRYPEMVGVSKYWSFDHVRMDSSLYVEAVKD